MLAIKKPAGAKSVKDLTRRPDLALVGVEDAVHVHRSDAPGGQSMARHTLGYLEKATNVQMTRDARHMVDIGVVPEVLVVGLDSDTDKYVVIAR